MAMTWDAQRYEAHGITLIETLVCVALVSILASLAAPEFRGLLLKHRIAAARQDLTASVQWARTEAIRRGVMLSLQRRTDCAALSADEDDWSCGWRAVAGDGITKSSMVAETSALQAFALPADLRLMHQGGGPLLQFTRMGNPLLVANKFIVSPRTDAGDRTSPNKFTSTLCMNRSGKVRIVEGKTSC